MEKIKFILHNKFFKFSGIITLFFSISILVYAVSISSNPEQKLLLDAYARWNPDSELARAARRAAYEGGDQWTDVNTGKTCVGAACYIISLNNDGYSGNDVTGDLAKNNKGEEIKSVAQVKIEEQQALQQQATDTVNQNESTKPTKSQEIKIAVMEINQGLADEQRYNDDQAKQQKTIAQQESKDRLQDQTSSINTNQPCTNCHITPTVVAQPSVILPSQKLLDQLKVLSDKQLSAEQIPSDIVTANLNGKPVTGIIETNQPNRITITSEDLFNFSTIGKVYNAYNNPTKYNNNTESTEIDNIVNFSKTLSQDILNTAFFGKFNPYVENYQFVNNATYDPEKTDFQNYLTAYETGIVDPQTRKSTVELGIIIAEEIAAPVAIAHVAAAGATQGVIGVTGALFKEIGVMSFVQQAPTAINTCVTNGVNDSSCWIDSGRAALTLATLGTSNAVNINPSMLNRVLNTTVSTANLGVDSYDTVANCFGENANSYGCAFAGGALVGDFIGIYGDLKAGQLGFGKNIPDIKSPTTISVANDMLFAPSIKSKFIEPDTKLATVLEQPKVYSPTETSLNPNPSNVNQTLNQVASAIADAPVTQLTSVMDNPIQQIINRFNDVNQPSLGLLDAPAVTNPNPLTDAFANALDNTINPLRGLAPDQLGMLPTGNNQIGNIPLTSPLRNAFDSVVKTVFDPIASRMGLDIKIEPMPFSAQSIEVQYPLDVSVVKKPNAVVKAINTAFDRVFNPLTILPDNLRPVDFGITGPAESLPAVEISLPAPIRNAVDTVSGAWDDFVANPVARFGVQVEPDLPDIRTFDKPALLESEMNIVTLKAPDSFSGAYTADGIKLETVSDLGQGGEGYAYLGKYDDGNGPIDVVIKRVTQGNYPTDRALYIANQYDLFQRIRIALIEADRPDLLNRISKPIALLQNKDGKIIAFVRSYAEGKPLMADGLILGSMNSKDIKDFTDIMKITDKANIPFFDFYPSNLYGSSGKWQIIDLSSPNNSDPETAIAHTLEYLRKNSNYIESFKNGSNGGYVEPLDSGLVFVTNPRGTSNLDRFNNVTDFFMLRKHNPLEDIWQNIIVKPANSVAGFGTRIWDNFVANPVARFGVQVEPDIPNIKPNTDNFIERLNAKGLDLTETSSLANIKEGLDARKYVFKKTDITTVIRDEQGEYVTDSYELMLSKIRDRMKANNETPMEAVNGFLKDAKDRTILTESGDPIVLDGVEMLFIDSKDISSRLVCGTGRVNCLETPVIQEFLLNDLSDGPIETAVIIGFGGNLGDRGFPYRHGALVVGDEIVGFNLEPRPVTVFQRYANVMKWGDFFITKDSAQKIKKGLDLMSNISLGRITDIEVPAKNIPLVDLIQESARQIWDNFVNPKIKTLDDAMVPAIKSPPYNPSKVSPEDWTLVDNDGNILPGFREYVFGEPKNYSPKIGDTYLIKPGDQLVDGVNGNRVTIQEGDVIDFSSQTGTKTIITAEGGEFFQNTSGISVYVNGQRIYRFDEIIRANPNPSRLLQVIASDGVSTGRFTTGKMITAGTVAGLYLANEYDKYQESRGKDGIDENLINLFNSLFKLSTEPNIKNVKNFINEIGNSNTISVAKNLEVQIDKDGQESLLLSNISTDDEIIEQSQDLFDNTVAYTQYVHRDEDNNDIPYHVIRLQIKDAQFFVTPHRDKTTTSSFAEELGLDIAINGDGWKYYERQDGTIDIQTDGYSMSYDGYVYGLPKNEETIYFDKDNNIYFSRPSNDVAITNAISYPNRLIRDGVVERHEDIVDTNPRTALGVTNDGTLILVAVDGKEFQSGMTVEELTNILIEQGAYNAVMFDSGSSTTMVMRNANGEITTVNNPDTTNPSGENQVANHLGIKIK